MQQCLTDTQGGFLRYTNWRRRTWQPAVAKAGLPDLTFHDLRALAGTCQRSSISLALDQDVQVIPYPCVHVIPYPSGSGIHPPGSLFH
jgi:integrase